MECSPKEVGTSTDGVVGEVVSVLLIAKVLKGIGPQEIAHRAVRGGLLETVNL